MGHELQQKNAQERTIKFGFIQWWARRWMGMGIWVSPWMIFHQQNWSIAGNNHADSVWIMLIHCLETMLFCGSFIGSFFHEIFCQPKSCALIFKFHMNWRQVQNVINFDERILENFGRHKRCWLFWCRIAGCVFGLFLGDELVLDLCFFWGSPGKMDYLS